MLGVLRRPPTPADALPASGPGSGVPPLGQGIFVNFIRRARVVAGVAYYVVPVARALEPRCRSAEQVFLVEVTDSYEGSSGATAAAIDRGKLFGALGSPGGWHVSGIVPDGVAKLTFRYAPDARSSHEAALTTTPVGNVFVATLPALPKTIVWRSSKGSVIRTIRP
jgi:hypothetical protein